ncbi:MAG: hypothetical protein JOZ99_11670 [Actinobacteria bacterium]|nr:hypothetical protein [Actinomycetota bacterium]
MQASRTAAALLFTGAVAFAGCGGGSGGAKAGGATSTSATASNDAAAATSSGVDVATQYQNAVRRADTATCRFNKAVAALGPAPKVRETAGLVPPVAAALRRFHKDLAAIRWPSAAKADASTVQQATDAIAADIETLPDQSPTSMPSWSTKIENDKAALASATRALRSDIGLLPLATETCT